MSKTVEEMFMDVLSFNHKFNFTVGTKELPYALPREVVVHKTDLLLKELREFAQAQTTAEQLHEITDVLYLVIGVFVALNVEPTQMFDIVHQANMSKDVDDFGNLIKPPEWESPIYQIIELLRSETRS